MEDGAKKVSYTQEMKKLNGFWESLEQYVLTVVGRSPLPKHWQWVVVGLALVVIITSLASTKISTVGATSLEAVVKKATMVGDYTTARKYWSESMAELEDGVYPERKVERRIEELEAKLLEYPGNKQIYLGLAQLYDQLGNAEKSDDYREKARILDPNR